MSSRESIRVPVKSTATPVASTVNVDDTAAVAVPEITPSCDRVNPAGSEPLFLGRNNQGLGVSLKIIPLQKEICGFVTKTVCNIGMLRAK